MYDSILLAMTQEIQRILIKKLQYYRMEIQDVTLSFYDFSRFLCSEVPSLILIIHNCSSSELDRLFLVRYCIRTSSSRLQLNMGFSPLPFSSNSGYAENKKSNLFR